MPGAAIVDDLAATKRAPWPPARIFLVGVAIWLVGTAVTSATKDIILVPVVIVAGSFTIPVAIVVTLLRRGGRPVGTVMAPGVVVEAFLGAGTLGLLLAALLESYLLPSKVGTSVVVGLIEETCKGLVIVLAARQLRSRAPLDGMVLGAVVGAGFGAFESAGYAFHAYISSGTDAPFASLVQSQISRALVTPLGHMLWSSILGGVLFAAVGRPGSRVQTGVVATFVGVIALHVAWDLSDGFALMLASGFTREGWHGGWPDAAAWADQPTPLQLNLFNALYDGLLLVVGLVGTLWFARRWRCARGAGARQMGIVTSNDVPAPTTLTTFMVPPSASTRSRSPMRPEPLPASAPPMPSSRMAT
ncbi:MAG: PrsW family intrarane metalloprotease [Actinomycetia bacterium]|nr:PrsW family intrarane metalloprotease [Actinomycetes bacterium]